MDANKFMTEHKRMCASYTNCMHCPMYPYNVKCEDIVSDYTDGFITKLIKTVENWSTEHPRKTRQSVFLEQYPYAECIADGILVFCPKWIDTCFSCLIDDNNNVDCAKCRHEYWMQEVE